MRTGSAALFNLMLNAFFAGVELGGYQERRPYACEARHVPADQKALQTPLLPMTIEPDQSCSGTLRFSAGIFLRRLQ
jgi:hypothetical protein